jgi:hypothetical protein
MVSEITRRNIFDALRIQKVIWAGRIDEPDFLARIFDLEKHLLPMDVLQIRQEIFGNIE